TDCADDDATAYPGALEVCDNDLEACGGVIDNGCNQDGDGYCAPAMQVVGSPAICNAESGGAYPGSAGTDCADDDATAYPGALEVCDNDLEACGGVIDIGCNQDGDGYCAPAMQVVGSPLICTAESGGVYPGTPGTDCDDSDGTQFPGGRNVVSIGNRVWRDTDHGVAVNAGDGMRQANETGVGGVILELFEDVNNNGIPEPYGADGSPLATTTSSDSGLPAQDGYYLFAGLDPGAYFVHIPNSNFDETTDPLWRLDNSDGAFGSGMDVGQDSEAPGGDENGINNTQPEVNGISSQVITLAQDVEPTAETDLDPQQTSPTHGACAADDDSDFTVDFGFYSAVSLGNRVFNDRNRNGFFDGIDIPLSGVTVLLYRDADSNGTPDAGFIASRETGSQGYFLFDETDSGELIGEGEYLLGIDPVEFTTSQELEGYVSTVSNVASPLPNPADTNDNGIDQRDVPDTPLDQVLSTSILLRAYVEPINDDDVGPSGHGRFGIQDANSNLTWDFGFYVPLSLGNRVFADSNNNQIFDPGESGINGVLVQLYQVSAPTVVYRSTVSVGDPVTGEDGFYLFDDLPEDNYLVEIAPRNFQNLPDDGNPGNGMEGVLYSLAIGGPYFSSEDTDITQLNDSGVDQNDNGIDEPSPPTNGVRSVTIQLAISTESSPTVPPDDLDLNTEVGEGTFGEWDYNADMTVDFGFFILPVSLGNRVFLDLDDDRQFNGSDTGVEGVVVNVFSTDGAGNVLDQDGDGGSWLDADDIVTSDVTDADGYYMLDGLRPGYFVIVVDAGNFQSGGVLAGYRSSQDVATPSDHPASPLHDNDQIEDGLDDPDPEVAGIRSPEIELGPGLETSSETDLGPEMNGEPNVPSSSSNLTVDFGFHLP
ncbi:MAG: hypothetical protein KZQ99_19095, partial [Candidatus Thiodiazotropha sp. (ex Dulcina madagascariensis)]|nr:hypothetical protein [Candidatus Thiodiazotropha sp. (ex Dulcina madagascariensis)]